MLGDMDFYFDNLSFGVLWISNFQVPRFPDFLKSDLGQAWAGPGQAGAGLGQVGPWAWWAFRWSLGGAFWQKTPAGLLAVDTVFRFSEHHLTQGIALVDGGNLRV